MNLILSALDATKRFMLSIAQDPTPEGYPVDPETTLCHQPLPLTEHTAGSCLLFIIYNIEYDGTNTSIERCYDIAMGDMINHAGVGPDMTSDMLLTLTRTRLRQLAPTITNDGAIARTARAIVVPLVHKWKAEGKGPLAAWGENPSK